MTTLDQLAALSQTQVDIANSQRDEQMLADDFDTFLQLLTTHLRNQDPLEPIKDQAFVAQLAQFSSLERLDEIAGAVQTLVDLASDESGPTEDAPTQQSIGG